MTFSLKPIVDTSGECRSCGERAMVIQNPAGLFRLACRTCGALGRWPGNPYTLPSEVRSRLEYDLRTKRNALVWEWGNLSEDEMHKRYDGTWDPCGPGTSRINQVSYGVAAIDQELVQNGFAV